MHQQVELESFPSDTGLSSTGKQRRESMKSGYVTESTVILETPVPTMQIKDHMTRIVACCFWTFVGGMSDAAAGALLPSIEKYYHISYAVVSMIWLSTAIGYIVIALLSHYLLTRIPFRTALLTGIAFQLVTYAVTASGVRHFAVVVVAFSFLGMGLAMGLAQYNVFLTCFGEQSSICLSLFHGMYGFGAFVSPLVAQQFLNAGIKWHYYYLVMMGMTMLSFVGVAITFSGNFPALEAHSKAADPKHEETGGDSAFVAAMKDSRTWLLSSFVFLYQGSEVAMGGWIVSFMQTERHGNPHTMGYVSSGYWAGLTIGRFLLTTFMHYRIGVRRSNIILVQVVVVLLLVTWLVPVIPVEAVAVSLVGVMIGPIYPLMVALCSRLLPRKILATTLLVMTSVGSSGGAVVPLLVGIISEFTGTWVLFPIVIAFVEIMVIVWMLLPNIERKGTAKNVWQRIW